MSQPKGDLLLLLMSLEAGTCNHPTFDPDDFFLEGRFPRNSPDYRAARDRAKAVCNVCPVQKNCLEFAIRNDERDGIWGGLTWNDRRELRWGAA